MLSSQQANFHFDIPEIRDISQCFKDTFAESGIDLAGTAVAGAGVLIAASMCREVLHRAVTIYYRHKVSCVVLNVHMFWRIPIQFCILLQTSCGFTLHTSCALLIHNTFCHLFREKSYLRTPAIHFRVGRSLLLKYNFLAWLKQLDLP